MRLLHEPMDRVALRARAIRPWRVHQFHEFGKDSIVDRPEWVYGAHHIAIGEGVVILSGGRLSAELSTWGSAEPSLVIGDRVMFRSGVSISAAAKVTIGENVLGGAGVSIVDGNHTITEEDQNPLFNPVEAAPVRIGAGTWLGERVTVLKGAEVGRKCVVGAHSVVTGRIPDDSIAIGIPARVVGTTRQANTRT